MTTTALKKKIARQLDRADDKLVQLVSALIDKYEESSKGESLMTPAQKKEVDRRLKLHKEGKLKYYTFEEVKKSILSRKKS
ncbi:MAG TPA: addiction module protein [Flavobacteriales bacterium]|nr:addiction module protein [Flavobacteriales bacterium]